MFGFFRNQLIEVIEWKEESNDIVLWKFPDPGNDSNIKYGAQLTVRESQAAIFLNEGQIADVYGPGRHTLITENMPILTTLKSWKHGFESPFKADVYFVSTRQLADFGWGTPNPIYIRDPDAGPIEIRAFGSYYIRIADPKKFFREYAGTKSTLTRDELEDTLRSLVVPKFAEALAKSQATVFEIYAKYTELGDKVRPLLQADLEPFGIELTKFQITSTSIPKEVEEHIREINKANLTSDKNMDKMGRFAQMDAMKKSAENGNYENWNMQQMMMQQMMMQNQMMQNNMMGNPQQQQPQQQQQQTPPPQAKLSRDEVMKSLKDLGELKQMGILTEEEFETKKKELLAQL